MARSRDAGLKRHCFVSNEALGIPQARQPISSGFAQHHAQITQRALLD